MLQRLLAGEEGSRRQGYLGESTCEARVGVMVFAMDREFGRGDGSCLCVVLLMISRFPKSTEWAPVFPAIATDCFVRVKKVELPTSQCFGHWQ